MRFEARALKNQHTDQHKCIAFATVPFNSQHFDKEASRGYFVPMKTVGLKALKNNLSQYVRAAAAGEVVRITDRDRVVAELRSPADNIPADINPALAEAIRRGHVRPAKDFSGLPPPPTNSAKLSLEQILRDLDEDRADRF